MEPAHFAPLIRLRLPLTFLSRRKATNDVASGATNPVPDCIDKSIQAV